MLKRGEADLLFAEKCRIFAVAHKEEVAHRRLPPLLYPLRGPDGGLFRQNQEAGSLYPSAL